MKVAGGPRVPGVGAHAQAKTRHAKPIIEARIVTQRQGQVVQMGPSYSIRWDRRGIDRYIDVGYGMARVAGGIDYEAG